MQNVSKVIVMDASGGRSKAIARSLKKFGVKVRTNDLITNNFHLLCVCDYSMLNLCGQNPYVLQGGFKSWVSKGLRVKEPKPETALTVLNEVFQASF